MKTLPLILVLLSAFVTGAAIALWLRHCLRRERNVRMGGGLADITDSRLVRVVFVCALVAGLISVRLPYIWLLIPIAWVMLLLDGQLTWRTIISSVLGLGTFALWCELVSRYLSFPVMWYRFTPDWRMYLPIGAASVGLVLIYLVMPKSIRNNQL